jgi:hypothetical protein
VCGFLGPSIRQSLSNDTRSDFRNALVIFDAKRLAVVIAKIEFREIAVQMLLAAMLIDALHAAACKRRASGTFRSTAANKPHARSSAVFVDEFNPGIF